MLRCSRKSRIACCQIAVAGILVPKTFVCAHTPPHSPSTTGTPVATATPNQWSVHTPGMLRGKPRPCM